MACHIERHLFSPEAETSSRPLRLPTKIKISYLFKSINIFCEIKASKIFQEEHKIYRIFH